jgi:hypothetical protein
VALVLRDMLGRVRPIHVTTVPLSKPERGLDSCVCVLELEEGRGELARGAHALTKDVTDKHARGELLWTHVLLFLLPDGEAGSVWWVGGEGGDAVDELVERHLDARTEPDADEDAPCGNELLEAGRVS